MRALLEGRWQQYGQKRCDVCQFCRVCMEVVHKPEGGVHREAAGPGDVLLWWSLTSSSEVFQATNSRSVCCQPVGHLGGSDLTLCAVTAPTLPSQNALGAVMADEEWRWRAGRKIPLSLRCNERSGAGISGRITHPADYLDINTEPTWKERVRMRRGERTGGGLESGYR